MIAKHIPMHSVARSSFRGLAKYITDTQSKEHRLGEVRISNCIAPNLPECLEDAMDEIVITQQANTRAKSDKTFHLLLSFRPDEHPGAETLRAIEDKICEGLGFGEHQRISAVHHDTDNLHIHIAINKIHPERFTIHEPYYPFKTLAKLCAQLEQEYALQVDNHEPKRTVAEGRAMDMEHHSGIESLTGWIQRQCLADMQSATTWQDLHSVLHENGLLLQKRGNGFVLQAVKTGVQVKASTVSRALSKAKLEAKLGEFIEATAVETRAQEVQAESRARPTVIEASHAFKQSSNMADAAQVESGQESLKVANGAPRQVTAQAKRHYQKRPIGMRIDTRALYERYQHEQKQRTQTRKALLEHYRKEKDQQIAQAKQAAYWRGQEISVYRGTAEEKMNFRRGNKRRLDSETQGIFEQWQQKKLDVLLSTERSSWADWLKRKAERGDTEALAALRAREGAQRAKVQTLYGQADNDSDASPPDKSAIIDGVTKEGTLIYRVQSHARTSTVRDNGKCFQVSNVVTAQACELALKLAMQRFGSELTVSGSVAFKAQMIRSAVDKGLTITFTDPLMEKHRKALLASKAGETHGNRQTERRGRAGSIASSRRRATTAASTGAGTSANKRLSQPHTGRARASAPPPPVARDRMRGMSQRPLAGLKTGIALLLSSTLSVFLRQQGGKPDSVLRRDDGLRKRIRDLLQIPSMTVNLPDRPPLPRSSAQPPAKPEQAAPPKAQAAATPATPPRTEQPAAQTPAPQSPKPNKPKGRGR